jgi:arylformamidase
LSGGLIDISMPLGPNTPTWPGSPGIGTAPLLSIANGDDANATQITMDVHCGTHVDAPRHFVPNGATIDAMGLDPFVGRAWVSVLSGVRGIGADTLDRAGIPAGTERLLLRTDNSLDARLRSGPFTDDYAALSADGASWVVDHGIKLIGIDYLSIQRFEDPPDTHQILLGAGVSILEGLELAEVSAGWWKLLCLPLKLTGTEAAPARAVVFPEASFVW